MLWGGGKGWQYGGQFSSRLLPRGSDAGVLYGWRPVMGILGGRGQTMRVVTMLLVATPSSMAVPPLHLPSSPRAGAPSLSQLFTSEAGAFIRQEESDEDESLADTESPSFEDRYSASPDPYSQERVDNISTSFQQNIQETKNDLRIPQEYSHKLQKINESINIKDVDSHTLYINLQDKTTFEFKNEDIKSAGSGSEANPVDVEPSSFVSLMREIVKTLMSTVVKGLSVLSGAQEGDSQQK